MIRRGWQTSRRGATGQGGADGGSFTPTSLSGLVLWLRGDLGISIGTGVSAWADQSGNGFNLTQATGAKQPSYTGSINGHTCPRFDGVAQYLKSAVNAALSPSALTLITVASTISLGAVSNEGTVAGLSNGTAGYTQTHYQGNSNRFFYVNSGGNNATFGPVTAGVVTQAVGWFDGTTNPNGLRAYQNNVLKASNTPISATYTGTQSFQTGLQAAEGANYWNGDLWEVLLYNRTLSAAELSRIYGYQRAFAGLP